VLVCVDNSKYKLPDFVDRVPIIYTTDGDILYDDYVSQFLESASSSVEDIQPFALQQSVNYSDNYSFLDDSIDPSVSEANKAYTIIGADQNMMSVPEITENTKAGFDNSLFDRYVQTRDEDDLRIKKSINSGEKYGRL
jgi:hypothetical protein